MRTLSAAGVQVIAGQSGTVRQALENFKNGQLARSTEANVADHYGMGGGLNGGGGMGRGMGGGMGRGMGGGMGRGMGGGMGGGMGRCMDASKVMPGQSQPSPVNEKQELEDLKSRADELKKQIQAIESRLKDTEKTIGGERFLT